MAIFVDYGTRQLKNMVDLGEEVIKQSCQLLANTQNKSTDPFWKGERARWKQDIQRITAENKAYIAELKRRGELS